MKYLLFYKFQKKTNVFFSFLMIFENEESNDRWRATMSVGFLVEKCGYCAVDMRLNKVSCFVLMRRFIVYEKCMFCMPYVGEEA